MTEQERRLGQVETTTQETVVKVEEIDQKTLSHAPTWARDVSKLLNPASDHDWRLLSSRLGYSNDDIRGWAQQADPCMAMLNEWYAVRKTSEATFAVLTHLQEMDRVDAAAIVENALKKAETVVEDEDFEYASPPEIFLSYQWSHQPEVKLLKQHLEKAGYDCWLDIGQMGGGDKLFDKIDKGIRAAKVVMSCVSSKYAKSPNCNREVNLAVNLNKPIIPIILEKCQWPPPGSMGPIFGEYLFVRFYQREGEELKDERYWPKDKFQELLMQLNMFGLAPEEGKVDRFYKNWWVPVTEKIQIDKSKTKDGGQQSQNANSETEAKVSDSPDIFISYQWGKQESVIQLYKLLCAHGFSCWLDINQMGGGDSLFDKIDRGIRGSKVVLSCVTHKYSLSANCRREVSLADALQKPLIPLLLEKTTWPPSGPMSMVMTQLLYTDFTEEQERWKGPRFDELLRKIQEHAKPQVAQEKSSRNSRSSQDTQPKSTSDSRSLEPNNNKSKNIPDSRSSYPNYTKPQSTAPKAQHLNGQTREEASSENSPKMYEFSTRSTARRPSKPAPQSNVTPQKQFGLTNYRGNNYTQRSVTHGHAPSRPPQRTDVSPERKQEPQKLSASSKLLVDQSSREGSQTSQPPTINKPAVRAAVIWTAPRPTKTTLQRTSRFPPLDQTRTRQVPSYAEKKKDNSESMNARKPSK